MVSRLITDLHPQLQPLCHAHLDKCGQAGIDVRVVCTFRSSTEQDALFALGRTVKSYIGPWPPNRPLGSKVTNAKGGQSEHNYMAHGLPCALAYDVGVFVGGKYVADGESPLWKTAGSIGSKLGLNWYGAPGAIFHELPHFALMHSHEFMDDP